MGGFILCLQCDFRCDAILCIGFYVCMLCRFLSVSRYIMKIADINWVATIYFENRRYNLSCADIFEKSLIYFGGNKDDCERTENVRTFASIRSFT